jgi:hypothetical protein
MIPRNCRARLALSFCGMGPDVVQPRPPDCTCYGEGLTLVSRVPRVGGMPELCTYRCEACGHVDTLEAQPSERQPRQ